MVKRSSDLFEVGHATLDAAGVELERVDGKYRVRSRTGSAEAIADDLLAAIELGWVMAKRVILAKAVEKPPQRNRQAPTKAPERSTP
jgi:hypothetical protein